MTIFVLGYPGSMGGANTECWHTVKLWRQVGWDVHLIPTWGRDERWRGRLDAIGAVTHHVPAADLEKVPGLAGWAETPFVCLHDDDLSPLDTAVLHDLVKAAEQLDEDQAVGPCGAILPPDRPYLPHRAVWCPRAATGVDLIKGRCLVARSETLLQRLNLGHVSAEDGIADDLVVCGALARGGRRHHMVPAGLGGRYRNLPVGKEASFASPDHARRRNNAFRKWLCPR